MDRSLIIRATELIGLTEESITAQEVMRRVITERCKTLDEAIALAASLAAGSLKKVAQQTYHLPDQPTLFDLPPVISVLDDDNKPTFYNKNQATVAHALTYTAEGVRYHKVQTIRFERAEAEVAKIAEAADPTMRWTEARRLLIDKADDGEE